MIRTRDFLLFILIVVFLLMGIGTTLIYERINTVAGTVSKVDFDKETVEIEVIAVTSENDREANLARLKEKIAAGESISVPDIDTVAVPEPPVLDTNITNRVANYCSNQANYSQLKADWPKKIVMREVEGARMVYEQVMVVASTASSTTPEIEEIPLLQLSLNQVRDSEDTCIAGDVIGITTTGALLTNNDVSRYGGVSDLTLIGYALDGLPIYGNRANTSHLDNCGGVSEPLGYRYYLRPGENFILGCFAKTPATFLR